MKIHLLRGRTTPEQVNEMLQALQTYIKLAVGVERRVLAGGGEWHADCEQVLLSDGSDQADIWGADWYPGAKHIAFEALINIRPRQNNRTMLIEDAALRSRVERIVCSIFEGPIS